MQYFLHERSGKFMDPVHDAGVISTPWRPCQLKKAMLWMCKIVDGPIIYIDRIRRFK